MIISIHKLDGTSYDLDVDNMSAEEVLSKMLVRGDYEGSILHGLIFDHCCFWSMFRNLIFENCSFTDCDLSCCEFTDCQWVNCKFAGDNSRWIEKTGLKIKIKETVITSPTNDETQRQLGKNYKVIALPNKSYVKIKSYCDFCHKETIEIYRRDKVKKTLLPVYNCNKQVCKDCYENYKLREKIAGNRHYGWSGPVSKYTTPMDRSHTEIIGLEMEFEGDFYGWKELQDAHKGYLHYGYDSSVVGQNELSWDCGSYSWWKYIAPLKDVCSVLGKYGGRAGPSAGIHVHVSRDDVQIGPLANKINIACRSGLMNILMKTVSLRTDREKFDRYSNLEEDCSTHHSAISHNGHGTVEFRIFNSTLDSKIIMSSIKFCKEIFQLYASHSDLSFNDVVAGLSKETRKFVLDCAVVQKDKGFITESEYDKLIAKF